MCSVEYSVQCKVCSVEYSVQLSIVYRLALTADYKEAVTQHHVSLLQLLLVRPHLHDWTEDGREYN